MEGWDDNETDSNETRDQLTPDTKDEENDQFFTDFGLINGTETIAVLNDRSTLHAFTKADPFDETEATSNQLLDETLTFHSRYTSETFQGIMPDSGAAGVSTAGKPQVLALQRLDPTIKLDTIAAGLHTIRFGKGEVVSQGIVTISTPIGDIPFHVVPANTPFLLYINNIDRIGIKLDNLENIFI